MTAANSRLKDSHQNADALLLALTVGVNVCAE